MMRLYAYLPDDQDTPLFAIRDLGRVEGLELAYAVTVKEVKLGKLSQPERAVWFHYGDFGLDIEAEQQRS